MSRIHVAIFACLLNIPARAGPAPPLPALGADLSHTTVSGLSSGAYMAGQFAVAYSSEVSGVALIAGGPYYCAGAPGTPPYVPYLINALTTCMNPEHTGVDPPDAPLLWSRTQDFFQRGWIDDPAKLARQAVYLFSGTADQTVTRAVTDSARDFYVQAGATGITYDTGIPAGHGMITNNPHDGACALTAPPYFNNCQLPLAQVLLSHLLPGLLPPSPRPAGQLLRFRQSDFAAPGLSMAASAYVYIPAECRRQRACRVHIAFHGCRQGTDSIGQHWVSGAGYNAVADSNRLIVLYPQVEVSNYYPYNPRGCWDFWGYTSTDPLSPRFFARDGRQLAAVQAMLQKLGEQP